MDSFRRYLCSLVNQFVRLERTGPEACQGWLVHVATDYVTLRSPEGADLYLPLYHIRSVTPVTGGSLASAPPLQPPPPETFTQLLKDSLGQSVRLYHAGPEVTVGVLREADQDHIVLAVSPDEIVGFARFHIRSLFIRDGVHDFLPVETEEPSPGGDPPWLPGQ